MGEKKGGKGEPKVTGASLRGTPGAIVRKGGGEVEGGKASSIGLIEEANLTQKGLKKGAAKK